jgi:ATP-binding cassette subfamily C exporter for protease/lipase
MISNQGVMTSQSWLPEGKRNLSLAEILKSQSPIFKHAFLFSVIINLLQLAPTVFMLQVYDRVITSQSTNTLIWLFVCVIGVYVACEMLDLLRNRLLQKGSWIVDVKLRSRVHDQTFEASLRTGTTSQQALSDLRTIREFLMSPTLTAILDMPSSLFFLMLMYLIGPWLFLITLFGSLILIAIGYFAERDTARTLMQANQAANEAQNYVSGMLRNASVIASMGFLNNIHHRWLTRQRKFLVLQAVASDAASINISASKFIQSIQSSVIIGAACWLLLKGLLSGSGGLIIVASTLGGRVLGPIIQLSSQWRSFVSAFNAYKRLEKFIEPQQHTIDVKKMTLPEPVGALSVESIVGYAPNTPNPIIRGVSFSLTPGENLVVIGPSAAGKSTLARFLLGIWPANSGKVRLDGADIHTWSKEELGPHIGYVPQEVELLDGTIAENIARFGEIHPDWLMSAAESVGLMSLIHQLPNGFETRTGDGIQFSGGQLQRIALARAIYGNPSFVVFDEPNSSLDVEGEEYLIKTLEALKQRKCTTIVITHRSGVIPLADKILILNNGQVAAFGPRDEILNKFSKGKSQPATLTNSSPKNPGSPE